MPAKKTQSKKQTTYIDPELEKFATENKEMVEQLLIAERSRILETIANEERKDPKEFILSQEELAKKTYDREKVLAEDLAVYGRRKFEDTAQGIVAMFIDPDFQRHMATAGLEVLLAFDALINAAPLPEFAKEAAEKARETRDNATKAYCAKNPSCPKKPAKADHIEKVKIE